MRRSDFAVVALVLLLVAISTACGGDTDPSAQGNDASSSADSKPAGIHNIKHVVIIMQENRSFDSYFGTYPGADGIPTKDGKPSSFPSGRTLRH